MGRLRMKWILMLGIIFSVVLSNAQEEEELVQELFEEEGDESKPNITLTGIPQIDYIHDPNLPRELNGYDLSTYPFLNKMPKNITFKCDGRHDGFYANIEWNCQVYHQCLFGIRYDFMCANFTSFDQKNFNCIFASDVDCPNSERFFDRNDALYKTTTTTTETPPFLGILRSQRPRRPHPQLARLRNSEGPRFEEYEDYDLPAIPKQRAEESKFQNAVNSDQAPTQDTSSQKLNQELGENRIVASFPVRAGTGQGRLRAIAQRRRRPGRPNRRRPFRPVYYDDYYDYYDDEYADTDKDDYDYDYSNNRFSIRRPGKKRPNQAKVNEGSQDEEETEISNQEKELSARPKNVENNSADAVEAQESKTQLSPTPEERRRLFQQDTIG
ncbi:uncharacterized protein LOC136031893 isoform X2 [Artemia franciscana]|uniref:uncharacterized protein LOC136031893 isoform X2 n=1 Tax=Artemia franciscana TaxID=6661 RepID=UPI0032DBC61C